MEKLKLVRASEEYSDQIMPYKEEMQAANSSMDGCGPLRSCETAEEWLYETMLKTDPATLPEGKVLDTQFLTIRESDNKVVGMVNVRHYFNDYLEKYGGHIGYSVRPSERRKGYATEQLRQALIYCKEELGLTRVLITCYATNEASRKTIVSQGGVYDGTVREPDENKALERYWITL